MNNRRYESFSLSSYDIFETFNKKQLKISDKIFKKVYKVSRRQELCGQVFSYCLKLIILDIIQNNDTFVLPLMRGREAFLHLRAVTGEKLKEARQKHLYLDFDLLSSNFTAYDLVLEYDVASGHKFHIGHLTKKYRKILVDNVNSGKIK